MGGASGDQPDSYRSWIRHQAAGIASRATRVNPVIIGIACLGLGGFLIYASTRPLAQAAAACRPVAAANLVAAVASAAVVAAFRGSSHLYVVALTIAGTICALFAAAERVVLQPGRG